MSTRIKHPLICNMSNWSCHRTLTEVNVTESASGAQLKATCPHCGAYLKFISRDELELAEEGQPFYLIYTQVRVGLGINSVVIGIANDEEEKDQLIQVNLLSNRDKRLDMYQFEVLFL